MPDTPPLPVIAAITDAIAPGKDLNIAELPATPITISTGSAVPAAFSSGARYLIGVGISFALGRGWIGASDVAQVTAAAVALVPFGYGIYRAVLNHNIKAVLEPFAPVEVAKRA